jgi:hypothetical protein
MKKNDRSHMQSAAIASIPKELAKISANNQNTVLTFSKRTTAGGWDDTISHAPPEDKTKSASSKRRKVDNMPPASITNSAKPLKTRDEREREAAAQLKALPSKRPHAGTTKYGKNAAITNRKQGAMNVKGKGKAVQTEEPEVIELDSEEEPEVLPQQKYSLAVLMNGAAASSNELLTLKSAQQQTSNNVIAPASPTPLASSHLEDHDPSRAEQSRHSSMQKRMATKSMESNGKKAPVGEGKSEQRARRRDNTPPKMSPTTPLTALSAGRTSESHIAYAERSSPHRVPILPQLLPPPPKLRSPSPSMFEGDGRPVLRPILERPACVDDPPVIDEADARLFQQIPPNLVPSFVCLADEMDRKRQDTQEFRLEDYLDFRGWKNQILRTSPDTHESALDAQHVWAAQKCWRAMQSVNIRRAEARTPGTLPTKRSPSTHEATLDKLKQTSTGLIDSKRAASVDPVTPTREAITIAQESPEFSVQPTPPKRKENANSIESPGLFVVRNPQYQQQNQQRGELQQDTPQGDEIQSPDHMEVDEVEDPPDDPIEDNDDADEVQYIGGMTGAR